MTSALPYFAGGEVIKGFGRGSKTLGCPTANLDKNVVDKLPENLSTGIYFGWAQVDQGPVFEQVTCIGWNPYFKNEVKSMETHVLNVFANDFYGSNLKVALVGYIRDEKNFNGLDELKEAIANDINETKEQLKKPEYYKYKSDPFFTNSGSSS